VAELVVVSHLTVKPGCRDKVLDALRDDLATAHGEEGVVRFAVHQVIDDPLKLVVIEVFRRNADLAVHYATDAFQTISELLPDLLDGDVDVIRTEPIPMGDPVKGILD
jgi:quinol monooxygenase YgiN